MLAYSVYDHHSNEMPQTENLRWTIKRKRRQESKLSLRKKRAIPPLAGNPGNPDPETWQTSCQNQDIQQDCLLEIHDKFQLCFARLARSIRLHCMIPHNVGIRKNSVNFSSSGTCPVALSRKEMLPLAGDVSCMLEQNIFKTMLPCKNFWNSCQNEKNPTMSYNHYDGDRKSQEIWASASNIQRGCFEAFLNSNTVRFATPMQILEKRLWDRSSSSFRPCPKPSTAVGPCQVENQASIDST